MPGAPFAPTSLNDLWRDVSLSGTAQGDLVYFGASGKLNNLAAGTSGKPLVTGGSGANPSWGGVLIGTNSLTALTPASGAGNPLTLAASAAVDGNTNGGDTVIQLVAKSGSGTDGKFVVKSAGSANNTNIVEFRDNNNNVGVSVRTYSALNTLYLNVQAGLNVFSGYTFGSGSYGMWCESTTGDLVLSTISGAVRPEADNANGVTLGKSTKRFKGLYLSGTSSIQLASDVVGQKIVLYNGQTVDASQVLAYDGATVLQKVTKDGYVYSLKSDGTQYSGLRGTGSSPSYPGLHCYHDSGHGYLTLGYGTWEAYIGTTAYWSLSNSLMHNATAGTRLGTDANVTTHEIYRRTSYANSATGAGLRIYTDDGPTGATNSDSGNLTLHVGNKRGSGNYGMIRLGYTGSAARGNISLFGAGSFGGGENVLYLATATTAPTSNPTGGFVFYVDPGDGAYKCRGPSGTITTLGVP